MEDVLAWLAREIHEIRLRAPHLPCVLVGRSAASFLLPDLAQRYPKLVDGLALISPVHIRDLDYCYYQHILGAASGQYQANYIGINFFLRMSAEIDSWKHNDNFFRDLTTPTWVATGAADTEVSREARILWKRTLMGSPFAEQAYVDVPGAEHDIFAIKQNQDATLKAFTELYRFIHFVRSRSATVY